MVKCDKCKRKLFCDDSGRVMVYLKCLNENDVDAPGEFHVHVVIGCKDGLGYILHTRPFSDRRYIIKNIDVEIVE